MSADLIPISRLSRDAEDVSRPLWAGRQRGRFRFASRLERAIVKKVGQAVADHELIEPGDRIMVCVSGGKDSYALLDALRVLQRRAPIEFSLVAVNVDQGWPAYRTDVIEAHLRREQVAYEMVVDRFAEVVEANIAPGATPCSLCSRLRRGVLYSLARRLGCTKIALGHHADDIVETLLLNLFYSGRLAAMPAKLRSDAGDNVVIRPLAYVPERLLVEYAAERKFPIVSCSCPSCGLPDQKRQVIKRMLAGLDEADPGVKQQMLAAVRNVHPSHLLDPSVFRAAEADTAS